MVVFDKEIKEDPLDDLDNVKAPNQEREGPIVNSLNGYLQHKSGGSYHMQDPKRGHLSSSSGCKRRSYLNYVHKLDEDLTPLANTDNTNWTFLHGDVIHEAIQERFEALFGSEHVTSEATVSYDLGDEFYIYGHADLVLRDLDTEAKVRDAIPHDVDYSAIGKPKFPDPFVIDIKTTTEFKYYNYGLNGHSRTIPKENNIMQLNGYMGILGAKLGALLYYSKRNDYLEEFWISYDQDLFEEAEENIEQVLIDVDEGNPSPRDAEPYLCDNEYCAYYREGMCQGAEEADAPDNYDETAVDRFSYDNPDWDSE